VIHAVEKLKDKDFLEKDSTISILVESIKRAKETMFQLELQISFILPDESSAELFTRIKLNIGGRPLDLKISFCYDRLLSWILDPKLSSYLIHDKDNTIYFEYEGEWLESLLPAIAMGDNSYDVFHSLSKESLIIEKLFTVPQSITHVNAGTQQTLRDIFIRPVS
jgi:hypothetical protein